MERLSCMGVFGKDGAAIEWRRRHETVLIGPWGADSFRVRGTLWQETRDDLPGALLPSPPSSGAGGPDHPGRGPGGQRQADRRDQRGRPSAVRADVGRRRAPSREIGTTVLRHLAAQQDCGHRARPQSGGGRPGRLAVGMP
jgi:hypothetical protein